jgi:hypothetical protein
MKVYEVIIERTVRETYFVKALTGSQAQTQALITDGCRHVSDHQHVVSTKELGEAAQV